LFGSGAARRIKLLEADPGDIIPFASMVGDVMAVGMGFVFWGITTGGSGGGGMCAGFPWPLLVPLSYGCCCPGAPAKVGGSGGRAIEEEEDMGSISAIVTS